MAFRSPASSSGSLSPSSPNLSPASSTLEIPMVHAPEHDNLSRSSSRGSSASGTPSRVPVDLPRTQTASRGGCWTCRLRRKKCDEQREGDSCKTCLRLTIECLGWGQRRPEWMRDKQCVEAYKANIKAQLTRAGLIRGQPRSSMIQAHRNGASPPRGRQAQAQQRRPQTYHRMSAPANPSASSLNIDLGMGFHYLDQPGNQANLMPGLPVAPNSSFHQLPAASYSDPNLSSLDLGPFHYSPQSSTSLLSGNEHLDFEFTGIPQNNGGFDFEILAPSPVQNFPPVLEGQSSIQEEHVMYYFENVKKFHFIFRDNALTNITYSMIMQDPRGALTNAVCACASLYFKHVRVNQGLEAPDPNPDHSTSKYFYDEALLQLMNTRQLKGQYSESDVLAAIHLVCYALMPDGHTDWQQPLGIALDWLAQTGLPVDERPKATFTNMSQTAQLIVKLTMWADIFSSLTLFRPPKNFTMYKRILGEQGYWDEGLEMASLTGCPDAAMLAIAEISALAHWKASEQRKGCLSLRELIRRGDDIEQRLRQHFSDQTSFADPIPLHPNLTQTSASDSGAPVSDDFRRTVAKIFRESALLYLHTVLSDANPAVPEINASVDTIIQYLNQIPPSEGDKVLVFPICIAACMTDDSSRRDLLKMRLQGDECRGVGMRTRLLMEAVWSKRDINGGAVDWRELGKERGLNLLLGSPPLVFLSSFVVSLHLLHSHPGALKFCGD